jgi:hypothetical protein
MTIMDHDHTEEFPKVEIQIPFYGKITGHKPLSTGFQATILLELRSRALTGQSRRSPY